MSESRTVATESVAHVLNQIVLAHDAVKSALADVAQMAAAAESQDAQGYTMSNIEHLIGAADKLRDANTKLNTLNQTAPFTGALPADVAQANKKGVWTWFSV